ncbi:SET domain protein, putative isoform 1 [Theobroma cacao]|uniref:SET domain protein, putative isoform 1 n=1 Tax=Theobroma cacao TaxID=3641 RepID=A0A061FI80_THECC|nr:SET domain protein, putative isoform 1 [Theobroma cacao]EOY16759.1 SET domain protein, putative isoform 1 [Theobroma cacao]EOY16761.1 SET domain protein, putative isoform 1 [Theobroma cacao]
MSMTGVGGKQEEMEMRAKQDLDYGQDITPPILPLSSSLYDSFLSSHCSSCFSPLPPTFPHIPRHVPLYCSPTCSSSHSPLHSSSAESLLPPTCPDSSDLRTALRLLQSLPSTPPHLHRIDGLLTNHHMLTSSSPEVAAKIRQGAIAMAAARKSRNRDNEGQSDGFLLEEAVLSLVITNAVEVQDKSGRSLGIAVYDLSFSWINHSCSPNACYRFSISSPHATLSFREDSSSTLRIVPSVLGEECDACSCVEHTKGNKGYELGPKIIVRSIKRIRKGEEVCVSYTDLLQPKAMRQSELWSKYQFTCSCSRCSASPTTYVDRALEEISTCNLSFSSSSFDHNLYRDEASKRVYSYMDETITEVLSDGDPESCCEKLESILNLGLHIEQVESKDGKSLLNFKLHPFHHLALNAYTTLTSAYRICSSDLLALHPDVDECQLKAFDMNRTSAAYSLLLAGATHRLFCSESSLIASAANFWTNAGESLVTLARSSLWNLFVKWGFPISEVSTIAKHKCSKCSLMDIFDTKSILSQAQRVNFENISSDFLDCVSNMTAKIWRFLVRGCHYLEVFEDPFDFGWLVHTWDFHARANRNDEDSKFITEGSIYKHQAQWYTNERRIHVYEVGIHCLLYGGILAHICYGQNSQLSTHVLSILYNVESVVH